MNPAQPASEHPQGTVPHQLHPCTHPQLQAQPVKSDVALGVKITNILWQCCLLQWPLVAQRTEGQPRPACQGPLWVCVGQ